MMIDILEAYKVGIKPQMVQAFYETYWPRKTSLLVHKFYEWQFLRSPGSKGLDHSYVAIDKIKQKFVGVMGVIPRQFHLGGQSVVGAEITTWMIHPDYRGKGVGSFFLKYLQKAYDVVIGMGTTEMVMPLYYKSGFRYLKYIPRYIKVLNWEAVSSYSEVTSSAVKMDQYWNGSNHFHSASLLPVDDLSIDMLNMNNQNNFNYFSRDAAYMYWRCDTHPVYSHKYFIISRSGDARNAVLVSLREEITSEARVLHLLDCVGDESSIFSAICFVEQYAKDFNFDAIDFYCTSMRITKFFLARGWFSGVDDELLKMPHLFHPIEWRSPGTTSLIYWAKESMSELCDLSKLYITKQDVDFDRPTYAYATTKQNILSHSEYANQ